MQGRGHGDIPDVVQHRGIPQRCGLRRGKAKRFTGPYGELGDPGAVPRGIRISRFSSGNEGGQRALVGTLLLAVLHERPARDEEREQDENGAERTDLRRDPKDDEEEPDDAVADLRQPGGREQLQDEGSVGNALVGPHDPADQHEVAQTLDDVGDHQRESHVDEHVPGTIQRGQVGSPARPDVDQAADRAQQGAHCRVEDSDRGAAQAWIRGHRQGADQSGADRADEDTRGERDDASGGEAHSVEDGDP
jgi:hypothetical protein